MKKVALYVRVSTKQQDTSIQKRELKRYCEYKKLTNLEIFEDKQTGTNSNRKALNELKSRIKEFDLVICHKLDRFFRSMRDLLNTLELFEKNGVGFVSINENINVSTKEGRLLMAILGSFAEFEAEVIRERIKPGIQAKIQRTGKWGKPRGKYGRASAVKDQEVIKLKKEGLTHREIAEKLNTHQTQVSRILKKYG